METSASAARRTEFRTLHEDGCFVIPNPWDIGSARYLCHLGFPALATTSAGYAFSRGLPDGKVPLDEMLAHIKEIVESVEVPVNADFGDGFAREPERVAENVRRCIETGVAGLSIEDSTGDPANPLYDFELAVERIQAAVKAVAGSGVLLTARAECYLTNCVDPLKESVKRLEAYAEAGADVLYAPGPRSLEVIHAIVKAVSPKPVNALMYANTGVSVADLAEMGVRRISVGSSLARAGWTGFMRAATAIAREGSFAEFEGLAKGAEINELFREDLKRRTRAAGGR